MVEKYWEAGPGSVYMSCAGIGHNRLRGCGDRAIQCVICAGDHKVESHRCWVTGCMVKMGKICTQVTAKCANCGANHQATVFKCPARLKAQSEAWKMKSKKSRAKDKQPVFHPAPEEELEVRSTEMDLDTAVTLWAKSLEQSSELSFFEDDMPETPKGGW